MDLNTKLSHIKAWAKENKNDLILFGVTGAVSIAVGLYVNKKITDRAVDAFEEKLAKNIALIPIPTKKGSYITVPIMTHPDL